MVILQVQLTVCAPVVSTARLQFVTVSGPVDTGSQLTVGFYIDVEVRTVLILKFHNTGAFCDYVFLIVVELAVFLIDAGFHGLHLAILTKDQLGTRCNAGNLLVGLGNIIGIGYNLIGRSACEREAFSAADLRNRPAVGAGGIGNVYAAYGGYLPVSVVGASRGRYGSGSGEF